MIDRRPHLVLHRAGLVAGLLLLAALTGHARAGVLDAGTPPAETDPLGSPTAYFRVTASRPLTITGLDVYAAAADVDCVYAVFAHDGDYVGVETDFAAWYFVDVAYKVSDENGRSYVPLRPQVALDTGETRSFIVIYADGGVGWNGCADPTAFANDDLALQTPGHRITAWGLDTLCEPWAGRVRYTLDFNGAVTGDETGAVVARAGDVDDDGAMDFIVASPRADTPAADAGSVRIYAGDDHTLLHTLEGFAAGDRLGTAVARLGDVNGDDIDDFAIGAPALERRAGRVYVIAGGSFAQLYRVNGASPGDRFGSAIADHVDVNGDGFGDLVVGAPRNDEAGGNSGKVSVFSGPTGALLYELRGERGGDRFGSALAGIGRVDEDAADDFIVGAPRYDRNASRQNTDGRTSTPGSTARGSTGRPARTRGEQLGRTVAGVGDVNADGYPDFAIGAPYHDKDFKIDAGRVKVMSGRTGQQLWSRSGPSSDALYGWSITGCPDLDGDGLREVLIGCPGHAFGGTDGGRVYLRSGPDGVSAGSGSNGAPGAELGASVASLGDADGDGCVDLVFGAPGNGAGKAVLEGRDPLPVTVGAWDPDDEDDERD